MKKKYVYVWLLSLIFVLTSCQITSVNKITLHKLGNPLHEIGVTESIIEYNEYYGIAAHYPVTGFTFADDRIESFINQEIDDFKEEIPKIKNIQMDPNFKAELNIDFESYLVNDDVFSIKINVFKNIPSYAHPITKVYGYNFSIKEEKQLTLDDVFKNKYLNELSKITRIQLRENKTCFEMKLYDDYLEHTGPNKVNFSNFVLKRNNIDLLFQRGTVFPSVCSEQVVSIPYKDLEKYIKIKPQELPVLNEEKNPIILPTQRKIDPDKPMVALTFDDGPHWYNTEKILDVLKKYNASATFFVVGNRIDNNSELLIRMIEENHEIGNHGWNHRQFSTMSPDQIKEQIVLTQQAVFEATGIYPKIVRPTYGSVSKSFSMNANLPIILWSVDSYDWKYKDTRSTKNRVLKSVKDGDIILMHDMYKTTIKSAEEVIIELKKQGYQFVTVSELYKMNKIKLEKNQVYYRIQRK